jgi:hypothetical protein
MELRNEDFPDLTLPGEELLHPEPRELATRITGTQGNSFWGLQASLWTSISNNDQEGDDKTPSKGSGCVRGPDWELVDRHDRKSLNGGSPPWHR